LDFIANKEAGGDLGMVAQVRRGIAWVYKNAGSFGGDPERIFIGGHSSGGHLCGVSLVTDWQKDFGLPENTVKGGLCMSGMYEMTPVRLSWRRTYVNFTDAIVDAMSAQRHLDKLHAPITFTYGTLETPDFQRRPRGKGPTVAAPSFARMARRNNLLSPCDRWSTPY
jgi:arylformamidase